MNSPYLYLYINLIVLACPVLLSFDKKVRFYELWKPAFLAATVVAIPFLIWDEWFTQMGVWGFNPKYLIGISVMHLPLEEILFFFTIPFACTFIYACLNNWFPENALQEKEKRITSGIILFLTPLIFIHWQFTYTLVVFTVLVVLLAYLRWNTSVRYLHFFYRAFLVALIPFFIVNGILTGSGLEESVVWYNEDHITSIRITTIPMEDFFYACALILGNVALVERFSKRKTGLIK